MISGVTKHHLNAPGRYYVDCETCLDHEQCVSVAPNNIKIDEDWIAYFFKQPESPEEEAQCLQALEECPIQAIRDDGTE